MCELLEEIPPQCSQTPSRIVTPQDSGLYAVHNPIPWVDQEDRVVHFLRLSTIVLSSILALTVFATPGAANEVDAGNSASPTPSC
jgi:hypothetical protein